MYITGGLNFDAEAYSYLRWPALLNHLSIRDCIHVSEDSFFLILDAVGPQLHSLDIGDGMSRFGYGSLDEILCLLPGMYELGISKRYITRDFGQSVLGHYPDRSQPQLMHLALRCLGRGFESPWYWIWDLRLGEVLPRLQWVQVYRNAPWEAMEGVHDDYTPRADERITSTWVVSNPSGSPYLKGYFEHVMEAS